MLVSTSTPQLCSISEKMVVEFQPWICWSFLWNDLDLDELCILNMFMFGIRVVCYYELLCRVQVCHASLRSIIEKLLCGGLNLSRIIIFVNSSSSLVGVYVLKMYQILQQRSMLYLYSGVRFRFVMYYCVQLSKHNWCGVPSLNMIIMFINQSSFSSWV